MHSETSDQIDERVDLSKVVEALEIELSCLLGPKIWLTTLRLSSEGSARVRARQEEIVDLLRHLVLDAHDAMQAGGHVTIRTGRLQEVAACAAIVIHEEPDEWGDDPDSMAGRIRKGRRLGLGASYDMVERAGGHFHVSCRGRETVLTICFPLAD